MENNKKFWNRFAFIHEKVQTSGKNTRQFYEELVKEIAEQLTHDMKALLYAKKKIGI